MKKRIKEETVIFISVVKWIVLATIIGIIVGFATALFLILLNYSSSQASHYQYYYFLLPVAMFLSVVLVKYLSPEAEGHGTEKVIEAVHKRSGKIGVLVVPVKLVATIITLALGGSAGKEGPCAQIGGGLASVFADIFRFSDVDRRKLVICGISGGFTAVFGTPIAGAIFGIEVLFMGSMLYEVLLPSFVAGIISYQVSSWVGVTYFYHPITFVPVFSEAFFLKVVVAGIFFGLCSFFFVELLNLGHKFSSKIKRSMEVKSLFAGGAIVLLTLFFSTSYLGLGLDTMESVLEGGAVPWYAFLMKSLYTSITLNFGGSGGIVTPIFFVGSTAGSFFARVIDVDPSMLAAIGFVSLLAGAANTPIAASIMAVEIFGPEVAPYAAVSAVISFVITGHRSVYHSQVLAIHKSTSIDVELGKAIDKLKPIYHHRDRSLIGVAESVWSKVARLFAKGGH